MSGHLLLCKNISVLSDFLISKVRRLLLVNRYPNPKSKTANERDVKGPSLMHLIVKGLIIDTTNLNTKSRTAKEITDYSND